MELAAHFDQALRRLSWVLAQSPRDPSLLPCPTASCNTSQCWLRACCEPSSPAQPYLSRAGRLHIHRLLDAGWTLRSSWPREWWPSIDHWLGRRLIFGHSRLFAADTRLISLVSSRLGRHGNQQPDWPDWLDAALRYTRRHGARLLIVPQTTLAPAVEHFARLAGLPCTTLRWTAHATLSDWLCDVLTSLAATPTTAINQRNQELVAQESLLISPAESEPSDEFQSRPLQDRLSLALADSVLVLTMRSAGNLEQLVAQRLRDPLFSTASVFVTLRKPAVTSRKVIPLGHAVRREPVGKRTCNPPMTQADWLKRGAVGWVVCQNSPAPRSPLHHCRFANGVSRQQPVWQLSGPLPAIWQELTADDNWPYLVHCTRGTLGPFPEESVEGFRERVWLHGDAVALHPLETLTRICQERRLRATCGITRTDSPCVSFSAVPLLPLLSRRTFQAHLGRWDWEPYGLLVHHQRLCDVGAAQVIYGSETEFLKLTAQERPFFQPSQRKHGKSGEASWTVEREWRVLHDVNLQTLPVGSVLAFTRTRTEAQQLAQYAPWPILWTERK